jgi:hypothetical protein
MELMALDEMSGCGAIVKTLCDGQCIMSPDTASCGKPDPSEVPADRVNLTLYTK